MRQSSMLLPTLKENPADADVASHRLMLRAGLIRQVAAGIYTWLPLGLRVIRNIEKIIREELDRAGAQEVLMVLLAAQSFHGLEAHRDDAHEDGDEQANVEGLAGRSVRFKNDLVERFSPG